MGDRGQNRNLLGPALERRPATEAVAIMEPDGRGLEGEVRRMAFAAYLVARKTLFEAIDRISCLSRRRCVAVHSPRAQAYLSTFVLIVFMNSSPSISVKTLLAPTVAAFANMISSLPYRSTASSTTFLTAPSSAASNPRQWTSTAG